MKKLYLTFSVGLIILIGLPLVGRTDDLASRLSGRILLQVEESGEAWYVNPETKRRSFLGLPDDAFSIMREQGLGITNDDLSKIPASLDYLSGPDSDGDGLPDNFEVAFGTDPNNPDSDGDGYDDYMEILHGYDPLGPGRLPIDKNFAASQAGKILLQVERNGEAWYVNPENNKRYFLGRPADAFNVMRNLGLGINNEDLERILVVNEIIQKICEIGKEYEHTAIKEVDCQCPDGYEFKVVSMDWGACPEEGQTDCPESILKCVKVNESFNCGDDVIFEYNGQQETYGTVEGQNKTCWLDRNLGASQVCLSMHDSSCQGDLFQWGRDDDGHQIKSSALSSLLSDSDHPGHGDFIINPEANHDWRKPQNNNLWQGKNAINNPCPDDWRIPTESELQAEMDSWELKRISGAFNSPLKWSPAGGRHYRDGDLDSLGSNGRVWSSSVHGPYSRYLNWIREDAYIASYVRAAGLSIRCIRD